MRDILVVCPQERDLVAIRNAGLEERYRVRYEGADLDQLEEFDPKAFLAEVEDVPADGAFGTKDLSALLASILTERRGLPGPSPRSLLALQHKPTSREVQRLVAPESTPRFCLLDGRIPCEPPFFAKPVVGRLSQNAYRIDDVAELERLHEADRYTTRYAEIAALVGGDPDSVHGFLGEELLSGDEVTLEGYVHGDRVTTIGVTDSVKYEGTLSFERFDYPSRLPVERQAELSDIAERVLPALGFEGGFFNVEFFVSEQGPAQIIEVNGRIASQFAPLVQSLHGRSTYDALFELACGDDPHWQTGLPDGVAVSYVMRVFEDSYVDAVPDPEDDLEVLVRPGLPLSAQGTNDAQSYRLAILYGAGETREEVVAKVRERAARLSFRLAPVPVR
ncbi:MAG TPA: ATP-grasp domain-containing protein [Gaiellaceae bacterium]|nr:ATP-grasp domain-containing protein [Gaiellaceae bacterium]